MRKQQKRSVEGVIASSNIKVILLVSFILVVLMIVSHTELLNIKDETKKIISFLPLVWATVLSGLLIIKSNK